jgi:hypothetical protein
MEVRVLQRVCERQSHGSSATDGDPREFDQGPREIWSIGESYREAPGQSPLSRLDPKFPNSPRETETPNGSMEIHGRRTAHDNTADQPSRKHFVGIAEKQWRQSESDAGFLLQVRKHRADGRRSFRC